jgi:hypothetical protein
VTRSVRALLLVAAGLVLLAGIPLFVFPLRTQEWFAWTVASPMTAVFLGASYWASAVLEVTGARARTWPRARISVPAVAVFTVLTLVATLLHLPMFHLGADQPGPTRAVTVLWVAVYVLVPVAMLALLVRQRRRAGEDAEERTARLPGWVRGLLVVLALLLGLGGAALWVAPGAAGWWGWELTPLTARAVGSWLLGLAVAAVHARVEDDVVRVRPLGATSVVFVVLHLVAIARYGGEIVWARPGAVGYVLLLACLLLLGVWALGAAVAAPARAAAVAG